MREIYLVTLISPLGIFVKHCYKVQEYIRCSLETLISVITKS